MKIYKRLMCLICFLTIWMLQADPVFAQSESIQADGFLVDSASQKKVPFTIYFPPAGGEVTGTIYGYQDTMNSSVDQLQLSVSVNYPDCSITGSFSGGDGGELNAIAVCTSKNFQADYSYSGMTVPISGHVKFTVQLKGNLSISGSAEGDLAYVGQTFIDAMTVSGQSVPAQASPEMATSGYWELTYPSEQFISAIGLSISPTTEVLTETPIVVAPVIATPDNEIQITPETTEITVPEITPAPTQTTRSKGNLALPISGAVIGTTTAALLTLAFNNKGKPIIVRTDQIAESPINGESVSPEEARWQNEQMAQGKYWNDTLGGFVEKHNTSVAVSPPSILTNEIFREKASRQTPESIQKGMDMLAKEKKDFWQDHRDFGRSSGTYYTNRAANYDKLYTGAVIVKETADISIEVLAKATGPAGKSVQSFYDVVTTTVDASVEYEESGIVGAISAVADGSVKVMGNYSGPRGKVISDVYSNVRDGIDYVNTTKEEGFQEANFEFGYKQVKKGLVDVINIK